MAVQFLVSNPYGMYAHDPQKDIKMHCLVCGETLDSWAEVDNHYHVRHPGYIEGAKRNKLSILNEAFD